MEKHLPKQNKGKQPTTTTKYRFIIDFRDFFSIVVDTHASLFDQSEMEKRPTNKC